MRFLILLLLLVSTAPALRAQLITTSPAAPVADQPVTITFDATQGTGGLADCNCDVYIHTGVITEESDNDSDWQYVQTVWGQANPDWQLTPVPGEPNKFTYTFGPSVRQYYGVPTAEEIQRLAFVFRNADGTIEGKATGNQDIFVAVSEADAPLGVTLAGDPGTEFYALGKPLDILAGATKTSTLRLFDNGNLVATTTGRELAASFALTTPGAHRIRFVATTEEGEETSAEFDINARLEVDLETPESRIVFAQPGDQFTIAATSYLESVLRISDGSNVIATETDSEIMTQITLGDLPAVTYTVTAEALGQTATTTVTFVTGDSEVAEPPAGIRPGAVRMENGDVLFQLDAPGKSDVFLIGSMNDWTPTAASRLKRSANDTTFWVTVPAAQAEGDLLYQYLIDGTITQPDPYSTLVLDRFNDPFITEDVFADIPDYPLGQTDGIVSWLRPADDYEWQINDYERPAPTEMVVYELLVRDFIDAHSFKVLTDTLDYLACLGINAIELMPVNEFEGNISWGYNPSFHMALDKYYGAPEDLKALVDACHERGIAVILDVVYNHAFGQSPLVRIWGDASNQPTADNPYANRTARHPFNVGFDLNHESPLTKKYVKTTTEYWVEEFRIDGFRFDLSKGFTQRNTGNDVGAWNQYDASRIAILKDYADYIWNVDPETYMIMEHLAESREEEELATYGQGMYFWSGFQAHDGYIRASRGVAGNLNAALSENRGFSNPTLVAYMESHDEERLQYENQVAGNSAGDYDIRDQSTGLDRVELASAFFYTLPGPKMLWQFGELGYDFPINYCEDGTVNNDCRTGPKPIRWDYRNDPDRASIYNLVSDLNYLRNEFDIVHHELLDSRLAGSTKYIHQTGGAVDMAVFGNFDVVERSMNNIVPYPTTWYDYLSGEAVNINNPGAQVTLAPGEFHIYLSERIEPGGKELVSGTNDEQLARLDLTVSPNPTDGPLSVVFELAKGGMVRIDLTDINGRLLRTLHAGNLNGGRQQLSFQTGKLPTGTYFLRVTDGIGSAVRPVVVR